MKKTIRIRSEEVIELEESQDNEPETQGERCYNIYYLLSLTFIGTLILVIFCLIGRNIYSKPISVDEKSKEEISIDINMMINIDEDDNTSTKFRDKVQIGY